MPIVIVTFAPIGRFILRWKDATTFAVVRTETWESADAEYDYPEPAPRVTTLVGLSVVRQTARPEPRVGRISLRGTMIDSAQAARIENILTGLETSRAWHLDVLEFEDHQGMLWRVGAGALFHAQFPAGAFPRYKLEADVEAAPGFIMGPTLCLGNDA